MVIIRICACLFLTILTALSVSAKVDPPNYDFSLDKLNIFMPGKSLKDIEKEYPKKEVVFKKLPFITYKFYVEHIRYRFPILVQFKGDEVTDFHARLPAYFLHDVFHQSLINRLGNQDVYKKVEEQATYVWKNKNGNKHIYNGGCSITCFPIFYAVKPVKHQFGMGYKPLIEKLNEVNL